MCFLSLCFVLFCFKCTYVMVMFAKIAIICQLNVIFLTRTRLSAHQIENDVRRWCRRKCWVCYAIYTFAYCSVFGSMAVFSVFAVLGGHLTSICVFYSVFPSPFFIYFQLGAINDSTQVNCINSIKLSVFSALFCFYSQIASVYVYFFLAFFALQ